MIAEAASGIASGVNSHGATDGSKLHLVTTTPTESSTSRSGAHGALFSDHDETYSPIVPGDGHPRLTFQRSLTKNIHSNGHRLANSQAARKPLEISQDVPDSTARPQTRDFGEDSSSDDDLAALRRSHTQPAHNPLSMSELNRVRQSPRNRATTDLRKRKLTFGNDEFSSTGRVGRDGRIHISVNETINSGYLAKALGSTIAHHLQSPHDAGRKESSASTAPDSKPPQDVPRMNIVIMVIGSRGDVQPFLKIGKILQDQFGHRVRIATHPTFKDFIEKDIGLEFFSIGGDPSELMAFMVKNPGLIPSVDTLKAGEIGRRRESMFEMFQGFWRACVNTFDGEGDGGNIDLLKSKYPFVADAIIANPPSFAHYHCAEKLGIPLQLVFTFPYSPTQAFPHPLANIKPGNVDQSYTNFMSYPLVDLMTWQGLGDLVNRFRVQTLGLEPVSTLWAPGQLSRLKVPTTYLWSPGLVPKPADWGPEIEIAGYVFLDLASKFEPPKDLAQFLERSDERPIVYIGFGSISGIDDPAAFTEMIFEGVAKANVRAVISKGWGGMGEGMEKPDGVFMIDNVPHDWLFPKVDAVVHHGGAGTTAAGLKFGKPTMIVPFFGDQPFWSAMVAKAGAGAKEALPLRKLDSDKFAKGIKECLEPEAKRKAETIAKSIAEEGDGAENAVASFHRALPLTGPTSTRCSVFHDRLAVWSVKENKSKLSAAAAELLVENGRLEWQDLELLEHHYWQDFRGAGEPITAAGGAIASALQEAFHNVRLIPEKTRMDIRRRHRKQQERKGDPMVPGDVTRALLLSGEIASAIRAVPADAARIEHARLSAELNLHGEAQPPKRLFSNASDSIPENLRRTETSATINNPTPIIVVKDVSRGLGHSLKPVIKLPVDLLYATTLGFRNAPRLYGDKTVRAPLSPITGFRGSIRLAGSEFYHGTVDGVVGLFKIPYQEIHERGWVALPGSIARGIGGLAIKPFAGGLGLSAYPLKGIEATIRRRTRDTHKTERWIQQARMAQGLKEIQQMKCDQSNDSDAEEQRGLEAMRRQVLEHWRTDH